MSEILSSKKSTKKAKLLQKYHLNVHNIIMPYRKYIEYPTNYYY